MNKELLEQIDSMIERLAVIELHTGKSEGTPIDKHTLLEIQKELKSQEIKDSNICEAMEKLEKFFNSRKIYEPNNTVISDCIVCLDTIERALVKSQKMEKENSRYEVIKKALINGIYAKDPLDENKLKYIPAITLSNVVTEWYLSNHCDFCVNVRDYKELFWLRKDKSE